MAEKEYDEEELDGFTPKNIDGSDIVDIDPEDVVDSIEEDPNEEKFGKAFAKEGEEGLYGTYDDDFKDISNHIYEELGYDER
jgi:hypothetical protein